MAESFFTSRATGMPGRFEMRRTNDARIELVSDAIPVSPVEIVPSVARCRETTSPDSVPRCVSPSRPAVSGRCFPSCFRVRPGSECAARPVALRSLNRVVSRVESALIVVRAHLARELMVSEEEAGRSSRSERAGAWPCAGASNFNGLQFARMVGIA